MNPQLEAMNEALLLTSTAKRKVATLLAAVDHTIMPETAAAFKALDEAESSLGWLRSSTEGAMKLYHYTAREYLPSIKRQGITRGDVPLTPTGGFNAPWLTDDPNAAQQDWKEGSGLDKTAVRIEVAIPKSERKKLLSWPVLADRAKMDPTWYEALDKAGGGGSAHWHVFYGRIPPGWFRSIEVASL